MKHLNFTNNKSSTRIATQAALLCCLLFALASCAPKDERPGLWLQGSDASAQIIDWRFTDDLEEIAIETRTWYLLAHSTTIWCVQYQGDLYVGSYGAEKKFWEGNIARDPRARIRLEEQLIEVVISSVEDERLASNLDDAYQRKYDMAAVFGDEQPLWWFYRVEQQI